ncbi:MAG: hypothetical protein KDA24_10170 [Deltaproteobacteria bacterium]|nr:hypothetical protein [Deltaproteobacteria bacterium]
MRAPRTFPLQACASAFAVALVVAAIPSSADAREDWFEPGALGMGGAVRVLGGDITAVRLSPAAMSGRPTYATGVSYSFYGRERNHIFSTGAYDSKTSPLALGSTYSVNISTPPFDPQDTLNWYVPDSELADTKTTHRWEVAAAYGLLERRINFGLGLRLLRHNYRLRANEVRFTMDTGVIFWPVEFLGLGVSLANFIPTKDDRHPTRFSGGVALAIPNILDVGVDAVLDFTSQDVIKADVHGGVTVKALQIVLFRAGYYGDRGFTENYITWGLGIEIPTARVKIKIDYGMRIEVGPLDEALRADRREGFQRIYNSIGASVGF